MIAAKYSVISSYWPEVGRVHVFGKITRARAIRYIDRPILGLMPTLVPQLKPQELRVGKKVFHMKIKMLLSREWEQMIAGNIQQILLHDV